MAALKFLSNISNMAVISKLSSFNNFLFCFFLFELFLVLLWVIFYQNPECCFKRIYILIKSSVLACSLWHCLAGEGEVIPLLPSAARILRTFAETWDECSLSLQVGAPTPHVFYFCHQRGGDSLPPSKDDTPWLPVEHSLTPHCPWSWGIWL